MLLDTKTGLSRSSHDAVASVADHYPLITNH